MDHFFSRDNSDVHCSLWWFWIGWNIIGKTTFKCNMCSTSLSYRLHKIIMRTLCLCAWDMAFNSETFVFVIRLSKIISKFGFSFIG